MILETITSPADVRKLDVPALKTLADEMRSALLNRLSTRGGHVGPNMGFVEATIALHYVFNTPEDKLIFDVSHQCYSHKLLTGRAHGFTDNTKFAEISGYSNPTESPDYDPFVIGHTSTSVALATGLQKARDMKGGRENIVAIIGDGSLSGGEAFEGLDMAAEFGTNIIVVVNDNEMSIAENHGGLYKNLQLLRQTQGATELNFFKTLGFDYIYEENGNDIASLIAVLEKVKDSDHPVVVHLHTEKGHGFAPAVATKEAFHWRMPFDAETGELRNPLDPNNYNFKLRDFLLAEVKKNPMLCLVTSATPSAFGYTPDKRQEAGQQFVDVGIAEEEATALISGMAKGGVRPVWNVFATFIQRSYDQIAQDLCINGSPAVINVFGASIWGMNDVTHVGFYDVPMLSNIPNLVYLAPTCVEELIAMEQWAISQTQYPVAIRVPGGKIFNSSRTFATDYSDLNKFEVVSKGRKVALIGAGNGFNIVAKVATMLKENDINPTVVNPRYLTGLDEELLTLLKKDHTMVVTVEDGAIEGGFGEKIARFYGTANVKVLVNGIRKGLYDRYDFSQFQAEQGLTPQQIAKKIIGSL